MATKGEDSPYLQLVVLPVDNESCDLLIHEEENCRQESGNDGRRYCPPLEPITKWINDECSIWISEELALQDVWDLECWYLSYGSQLVDTHPHYHRD